jgi:hypothetical protein
VFLLGTGTRLTTGAGAADFLAATRGFALVTADQRLAFHGRLAARGLAAEPLAEVSGINYSKGERVDVTIYRLAGQAASPH